MFAGIGAEADRQFVPDAFVAPVLDLLGQRHVHVIAAARVAAHRGEREAAFVVGVDQFVVARRHVGQDAQPAERIDPFEFARGAGRDRLARRAVEAVAAGDEARVERWSAPSLRKVT
jgi:hypothetical protein